MSHAPVLAAFVLCSVAIAACTQTPSSSSSYSDRQSAVLGGTTYYVDPVNGVDTNDGLTLGTAVKTIVKAGQLAGPGDTVNLRGTGHFPYSDFDNANWSGTPGNVITVQSNPGETAVFDPGLPEFKANPNTAWAPCTDPGAVADEYVSVNTYATETDFGTFLSTGTRLLWYDRVEDFRASNESWVKVPVSDPRPGAPIWGDTGNKYPWTYRGPGLWWDDDVTSPSYHKIHFRASPTHYNIPGVSDYSGPTDPRSLSLSISPLYTHSSPTSSPAAISVEANYITFKNITFQNGGNGETISLYRSGYDVTNVTFDHCAVKAGRYAFRISRAKFLTLTHSTIDSQLASYTSRSDVKDNWYVSIGGVQTYVQGTSNTSQMQFVTNTDSQDIEIDHCEFRNAHDSLQLYDLRVHVHDSLFENINDEVFSFQYGSATDDVRVYNNVIRKALTAYSFAQQGSVPGNRYIYRNVFDNRVPTLGSRVFPPDVPPSGTTAYWRTGADFKTNAPVDVFYFYQNTTIQGNPEFPQNSAAFGDCDLNDLKTRRYVNNIHMTIQTDKSIHNIPDPGFPVLSDGNIWSRRINNPTAPLYAYVNSPYSYIDYPALAASPTWTSFFNANGVGWDTHSQFVYPQFGNVSDYAYPNGVPYLNSDYRLKSTSPARGTGVDLTATGWPDTVAADSTPDIGALPYGAAPLAVGVDGRYVFPDSTTPVAEAGDYTAITDTNQDGFETISLDSAGSSDPDGTISSYSWALDGYTIGSSATGSVSLPVGDHKVFMTVTDNTGHQATDMRQVTIGGSDNIVRNPGFESGSTDWDFSQGSAASVVTSPIHLGGGALQAPSVSSVDTIVTQNVPVTPGAALSFSGWDSGVNFSGAYHYSKLSIKWLDASGGLVSWSEGVANLNQPYTLRTQSVTIPSTAVTAQVYLAVTKNAAPGIGYFDDVFVAITDNKVSNSHFERGLTNWAIGRGTPTAVTDSGVARSGYGAINLTGQTGTEYQELHQDIPVTQGQVLFISGWLKTANWPAGKYAYLKAYWVNSSHTVISVPWGTAKVDNTATSYTQVSTTLPAVPSGVAYVRPVLIIDGGASPGVAYYDDIYVR